MATLHTPERLEQVAAIAAEHATRVDTEAAFPRETLAALREHGYLGLASAKDVGGQGASLATAVDVVARLGRECGSSAMVLCMHYCATAVIEAHAERGVRERVAAGQRLATLAFSESGSRSHFWAPLSSARAEENEIVLDGDKSWVTAAGAADLYVWSSRSLAASAISSQRRGSLQP